MKIEKNLKISLTYLKRDAIIQVVEKSSTVGGERKCLTIIENYVGA